MDIYTKLIVCQQLALMCYIIFFCQSQADNKLACKFTIDLFENMKKWIKEGSRVEIS